MMGRSLESEVLRDLSKVYHPIHAMNIYYAFVAKYKVKHLGEMDVREQQAWLDRRGVVFRRYANINYLHGRVRC